MHKFTFAMKELRNERGAKILAKMSHSSQISYHNASGSCTKFIASANCCLKDIFSLFASSDKFVGTITVIIHIIIYQNFILRKRHFVSLDIMNPAHFERTQGYIKDADILHSICEFKICVTIAEQSLLEIPARFPCIRYAQDPFRAIFQARK